jgi:hypothetical protein
MFIDKDVVNSPEYLGPKFTNEVEEMKYFANQCKSFLLSGVSSISLVGQILGIHPDWVALLLYHWGDVSREEIEVKYGYKLEGAVSEVIV